VTHAEQGIALAERLDHLYSRTIALAYAALLHQMRLDLAGVVGCADEVVALCDQYDFAYYGDWARVLLGWARSHEQPAEGIRTIESALGHLDRHRAQARRPYYLSLLADAYGRLGDRERMAAVVDRAIDMAHQRGDVWWLPALYLQRSGLVPVSARESILDRALALTRASRSLALEERLLAATR
jgi:hypothetical protein